MAPPQKDTSFQNFLKEFFNAPEKLPPTLINKIYAFYKDGKIRNLVSVEVESSVRGNKENPSSLISTFVAGGEEALLDVKGINTTLDLRDLVKNPFGAVQALGQQTIKDIGKLDEQAADKRSDTLEGLTTGELRKRGRELIDPGNIPLRGLVKLGLPLVNRDDLVQTNARGQVESAIRLVGSPIERLNPLPALPPGRRDPDSREDRQVLEQGRDRESRYKVYRDLAGNLTGLGSYMEATSQRAGYYRETVMANNRVIASELGIDLDNVLPVKGKKVLDPATGRIAPINSKGTFWETLEAQSTVGGFTNVNEALEDMLNDDAKLRKALGWEAATPYNDQRWANLDPRTKEYAKDWFRSEFTEQGFYEGKDPFGRKIGKVDVNPLDGIFSKTALELQVENTPLFNDMALSKPVGKPSIYRNGVISREKNKRALEAHARADVLDPLIISKVSEAAHIYAVEHGFDPIEARREARARLMSAAKAGHIADNLFFASTTKEMLENIEKGKFLQAVLLNTKIVGLLPFTESTWGTPNEYMAYLDKFGIGKATKLAIDKRDEILKYVGLAFDADESELTGIAKAVKGPFKGGAWVSWNKEEIDPVTGKSKIFWTQANIKPGTAGGIFEPWGLQQALSESWGQNGDTFRKLGFPNPDLYDPNILLQDLDKASQFMEDLLEGAENFATGAIPANADKLLFKNLAEAVGLGDPAKTSALRENITAFKKLDGGGKKLLELLASPSAHPGAFVLDPSRRWDFLLRIIKENKVNQILKPFTGLLNTYNRAANALYTFLYREMLWGGYAGKNAFIKATSSLIAPIRPFLNGIGFADETLLAGAVQKWGIIKWFNSVSTKFYALGQNPAIATSGTSKFLTSFLGPTMLKTLGFLAGGVGGAVTGGLSYVLSAFSEIGWGMGKELLKGNITGAFVVGRKIFVEKVRTVSKLVFGIILGVLTCVTLPFIFVITAYVMLAPLEPATGGGAYADIVGSKKIKVTKTATLTGDDIQYLITIKNITDASNDPALPPQDVTITSFIDTVSYTKSCADGGGIVDVVADPTYGSVNPPQLGNLPKTTLAPGETMEVGPFNLINIKTGDGTYLNSVEVMVENDEGKKGEASASTKLGAGGCDVCPAGWPTTPFVMTQGWNVGGSIELRSHASAEAIDMGAALDQPIKPSHNGTIVYGTTGPYGNHAKVTSSLGFSTIYAHMNRFSTSISSGQEVSPTDVIGYVGSTGNSDGNHLHYEFVNKVECLPSRPLRMIHYPDTPIPGSYIPANPPNPRCYGAAECNFSVN